MSSDEFDPEQFVSNEKSKSKKRLSVERIYQKKTQLEHVLLRPDTYIGSVEQVTQQMWVYDNEQDAMVLRDISFVPGLYKIFDEILVNAADNKQRDNKMDCIKVDINPETNRICIYNNGKGIPVIEHKDEKMYVPSLIFGHLLTSSNYNDEEKKVTGGRNGYGAKLCNIFSTKFIVETSSKEYKKSFKQTWQNNMSKSTEAQILPASSDDYTKITFYPDLTKFKMDKLDKDIVDLMSRRAYDIAGSSRGVKVYLNGKRLPVKGFKDYVDQYLKDKEDETGNPLKTSYESVNDRWEVAVALSEKGFQQVSFVNSIATTKGGRHVDYVTDQIVAKLIEIVKKKNKAGVNIKPFQVKNHLWVFVNCLIENPTFDSQTKENMTLQPKSFGSKCQPSDKFFNNVSKIGIIENILTWIRFKAETQLAKKCHTTKHSKLKGIPKLEDANDAGTKNSIDCTLILTEGDSAKSLVIAGLSIVGRDKFGVFPLRGKMLNVREATHKQIMENAEINNIIKIMGLQYKKKYDSIDDLKTLRYGKLMIMTDQDQDGSHIKGLLINFIHHNWPSLLRLPFLEEFITPIVKISKGSQSKSFYSLPEFEEWKRETENWSSWKIKYYKGLGTSTPAEAKEYFSEINRHRISFKYEGPEDDHFVTLAFSKKMVEQRKDWLTNGMENRKRRRELGLSEIYLYEKNTRTVSYKDFVNKELILFSNMDNERSIPSVMDGLKPGQRKVLFTCFKRNDKREVKVAQLAGSVGELSAYHHGEASLMSTIINLAQNYVGSNNINLLQPIGQFGTRLQGGKDAASPRYIFTMLSPLARRIFDSLDEPLLNHLYDDNLKIEPEYYAPIIPMVLVNGAEGIGTGWSTKIPNYNPREIVDNLFRLIRGDDPVPMKPWFKGFVGTIEQIDNQRYVISGECATLDEKSFEVTELPIRVWTQTYKESVLEPLLHGSEKVPAFITDYKEYHTDTTIRFVVTLSDTNLRKSLEQGLHKTFKLQTSFTLSSMVLFDHNGCLRRYESPEEIIHEFFSVRLEYYAKRKSYYEGILEAEAQKLQNQARFILEKNDGRIKMENVKKVDFIKMLINANYDSDPVKAWKKKHCTDEGNEKENENEENDEREEREERDEKYDFDYLIDMTMRSMLREKVEELLKKRDAKRAELEKLKNSTAEELWETDLNNFLEELDKVEKQERDLAEKGKPLKLTGKLMVKGKSKSNKLTEDTKPSVYGDRVAPKIDAEYYKKSITAAGKKAKDRAKLDDFDFDLDKTEVIESDDEVNRPLAERIGTSPKLIDQKKGKTNVVKKTKEPKTKEPKVKEPKTKEPKTKEPKTKEPKTKEPKEPKKRGPKKTGEQGQKKAANKKKKNPWSDTESSEQSDHVVSDFSDDEDDYVPVKTVKRKLKQIEAESDDEAVKNGKEDEVVNNNGNKNNLFDSDTEKSDDESDKMMTEFDKMVAESDKMSTESDKMLTENDKNENGVDTVKPIKRKMNVKPSQNDKQKPKKKKVVKKKNPWSDTSDESDEPAISNDDEDSDYIPVI